MLGISRGQSLSALEVAQGDWNTIREITMAMKMNQASNLILILSPSVFKLDQNEH